MPDIRPHHIIRRVIARVDAGITDEWFARGVGLVKRSTTSIAGPRTSSLIHAIVAGRTYGTARRAGG